MPTDITFEVRVHVQHQERGFTREIEATKGSKKLKHYVVTIYEDGWPAIAKCTLLAHDEFLAAYDALKPACATMTAKPDAKK